VSEITIRPRVPADDERYVAMRHAIAPDRAPLTLEEHRRFMELEPERTGHTVVVAERDGEVLGVASWARRVFTAPEDTFWTDILVDRNHWGTGVGRALWDHALRQVEKRGARKIFAVVREDCPEAEAWATRRGFARTGHGDRMSRLEVEHATPDRSREAARRVGASGIHITTLAELGTDDRLLHALKELDDATTRDIPGEEDYQGPLFEEWKTIILDTPGVSPDVFWVAMDGDRPVGMAPLQIRSGGYADNFYTCVAREYRGRGIARALKLRGVEWARENGIRYLITGNDPANKPMLAVNIDLGYQFLPANIQLAKEL
jgi:mycothiol synthase